jgi:serralysin
VTDTREAATNQDGTDQLSSIRFLRFSDQTIALTNAAPTSLALSAGTVAETTLANTTVAALSGLDPDGDALSYSLTSNPGGLFRLDGTSLVLLRALDYETAQQHTFAIKAQDAYGGETVTSFTLAVANVVETTPLRLTGTAAANRLTGEAGGDLLFGLGGADILRGEAGNDKLYGGLGKDVLTGGAGKDIFVFDTKPNKATNLDKILDFRVKDDTIWLDNKYMPKLGAGSVSKLGRLNKEFFSTVGHKEADDYLSYSRKTGVLSYDADGSGLKAAAVAIAILPKNLAPTHLDFLVF